MKRRRWNWIWLFLGVFVISASCGFGYEAKHARSRFEEAKDAFGKQDWERVVENLSDTKDPGRPEPKAFAAFLHAYVDPELALGQHSLIERNSKSSLVPIDNEVISYQVKDNLRPQLLSLRYVDDAVWFDIPFSKKRVGVFRGKLTNMSFFMCFYRICQATYPQVERRDSWKSVLAFVKSEQSNLVKMGISPKNLYSKTETWPEYIREYEERIEKMLKVQKVNAASLATKP